LDVLRLGVAGLDARQPHDRCGFTVVPWRSPAFWPAFAAASASCPAFAMHLLRPKSFAGLFGAAPSVALATLIWHS
jgi:hypothetical protein